jgi:APA family basic amino acid/polyamine antiporter
MTLLGDPLHEPAVADLRQRLLRVFGLGFGLAVVVGGVIGSGIMRNPGVVAAGFPSPMLVLLVWLAGGIVVTIDAMPTVELGAAIPEAGGPYALATRVFGPFWGFVVGWADWLQLAISTGFITVAFGEYVQRLGWFTAVNPAVIAIALVLACGILNGIGAKASGLSQDIGSAVKGVGLVILVAVLVLFHGKGAPVAAPPSPIFSWAAAAVAVRAIYGAYGGWHSAVYFSEEVHNPQHAVARATFGGIALVTTLYLLVNAAVLHVLPIGALANSTLAAADAAKVVLGPGGGVVVTALAIIAVATLANLQIMEHSRNTFAMARKGLLPPRLARVSKGGAPRASLMLVLVSVILIIAGAALAKGKLYEILLNLYAPMAMVIFFMISLGAIVLRRQAPNLDRPYRMPLYPLPAVVSMGINLALLLLFLVSDWKTGLISALFLAAALPLYAYGRGRWR